MHTASDVSLPWFAEFILSRLVSAEGFRQTIAPSFGLGKGISPPLCLSSICLGNGDLLLSAENYT